MDNVKKTIRIIHTADFQIGKASNQIHINKMVKGLNIPVNIRTIDLFKKIKQLFEYCIKEEVHVIVIAGDIFQNHIPKMYLKKWFASLLNKVLSYGKDVILLIGNHDSDGNMHVFADIQEFIDINKNSHLYIVDKPKVIELCINFQCVSFFCLPYLPPNYSESYKDVIFRFMKNQKNIVIIKYLLVILE